MEKTRIILLSGFLGAGKTTLLKRLLKEYGNKKTGVIVNEFGSVNIDAKLIENKEIEISELSNGSIFCACIKDKFVDALIEMAKMDLNYLFIEASGLADPSNMLGILDGLKSCTGDKYVFLRNLCIVDGQTFMDLAEILPSLERQIKHATTIIVNKSDLIDDEKYAEISQYIKEINATAPIYRTTNCDVDMTLLMNQSAVPVAESEETTNAYDTRPATLVFHSDEPLPLEKVKMFVSEAAKITYRMKGFVSTDKGTLRVDAVGENVMTSIWEENEKTELVLISSVGIKIVSETLSLSKKYVGGKLYL